MIDAFETPQEFCVVTEFAQVHMNLVWLLCAISSTIGFMGFGWLTLSDNACPRVNCLRYSRTMDPFLKNKFRRLLSSWYDCMNVAHVLCFSHMIAAQTLFRLPSWFQHFVFSGKSIALLAFKSYYPPGYETSEHSYRERICCKGTFYSISILAMIDYFSM
jgi:hypothetical protein